MVHYCNGPPFQGNPNRQPMNIYFILAENGLVKIGVAVNVNDRLKDLSKISPIGLKLLGVKRGGISEERKIHLRFNHLRHHGEWFYYADEIKKFIKE